MSGEHATQAIQFGLLPVPEVADDLDRTADVTDWFGFVGTVYVLGFRL
jgi:hypothetical protein